MSSERLPAITLVTPSFNQAEYIGETIESVLSQGYPRLEYIIIDGGSTDGSVEIIRKYEKHLAYWVSERDRGQSDAINKGFRRATGEVFNWLCSDDTLEPGSLEAVGKAFAGESRPDVVVGKCRMDLPDGPLVVSPTEERLSVLPFGNPIPQPSCYFRRSLVAGDTLVRNDLHYVMDLELWHRFRSMTDRWQLLDDILSTYRMTELNKTSVGGMKIIREHDRLLRELDRRWIPLSMAFFNTRLRLDTLRHAHRSKLFLSATAPLWRLTNMLLRSMYGEQKFDALDTLWFTFLWHERARQSAERVTPAACG